MAVTSLKAQQAQGRGCVDLTVANWLRQRKASVSFRERGSLMLSAHSAKVPPAAMWPVEKDAES